MFKALEVRFEQITLCYAAALPRGTLLHGEYRKFWADDEHLLHPYKFYAALEKVLADHEEQPYRLNPTKRFSKMLMITIQREYQKSVFRTMKPPPNDEDQWLVQELDIERQEFQHRWANLWKDGKDDANFLLTNNHEEISRTLSSDESVAMAIDIRLREFEEAEEWRWYNKYEKERRKRATEELQDQLEDHLVEERREQLRFERNLPTSIEKAIKKKNEDQMKFIKERQELINKRLSEKSIMPLLETYSEKSIPAIEEDPPKSQETIPMSLEEKDLADEGEETKVADQETTPSGLQEAILPEHDLLAAFDTPEPFDKVPLLGTEMDKTPRESSPAKTLSVTSKGQSTMLSSELLNFTNRKKKSKSTRPVASSEGRKHAPSSSIMTADSGKLSQGHSMPDLSAQGIKRARTKRTMRELPAITLAREPEDSVTSLAKSLSVEDIFGKSVKEVTSEKEDTVSVVSSYASDMLQLTAEQRKAFAPNQRKTQPASRAIRDVTPPFENPELSKEQRARLDKKKKFLDKLLPRMEKQFEKARIVFDYAAFDVIEDEEHGLLMTYGNVPMAMPYFRHAFGRTPVRAEAREKYNIRLQQLYHQYQLPILEKYPEALQIYDYTNNMLEVDIVAKSKKKSLKSTISTVEQDLAVSTSSSSDSEEEGMIFVERNNSEAEWVDDNNNRAEDRESSQSRARPPSTSEEGSFSQTWPASPWKEVLMSEAVLANRQAMKEKGNKFVVDEMVRDVPKETEPRETNSEEENKEDLEGR